MLNGRRKVSLRRTIVATAAAAFAAACGGDNSIAQIPHDENWPPSFTLTPASPAQAFCQMGRGIAVYELVATNLEPAAMTLDAVRVAGGDGEPRLALDGADLASHVVALPDLAAPDGDRVVLEPGRSVLVHLWVDLGTCAGAAATLTHDVAVSGERPDGGAFAHTFQDVAPLAPQGPSVIAGPPVKGVWILSQGLADASNHRRVIVPAGEFFVSQKFGFDLVKVDEEGRDFPPNGDVTVNDDHFSYGETVYAMTDGEVVAKLDGLPENQTTMPPAVPFAYETAAGDHLIVKAADDTYFLYAHLIPGSATVEVGDTVVRGEPIARVGNSGNAAKPHLHVHAMSRLANPNAAHGRAFAFDAFDVVVQDYRYAAEQNARVSEPGERRENELPPPMSIVRFEP